MDKPLSSNASTSENLSGKGAEATPKVSTTPHPNHTRATAMLGSIVGDIVGSIYEFANIKTKDFEFFQPEMERTDDSILCIATADWLLHGGDVSHYYSRYGLEYPYPMGGYGGMFKAWSSKVARQGIHEPYNSCGNGSAMRIAPVGWAFETEREVLATAEVSASCTHNHPEGIKGAQATALCIFLARQGHTASDIRARIERDFGYDLSMSVEELQRRYSWQGIDGKGDGGIAKIVYRRPSFVCSKLRTLRMPFAMRLVSVKIVTPSAASPEVSPKLSTASLSRLKNEHGSIWTRPKAAPSGALSRNTASKQGALT